MRSTPGLILSLALAVLLAPGLPSASRADDTCDVRGAPRVVAVGDVHGAYDNVVAVLQMAGIVDDDVRWAGGKTHLVQTGDLLDHGKDTRKVLDLMMRLEKEAKKAGGRVIALIGNHEVMNILGDVRFVDPEEYEAFRSGRSATLRDRFLADALKRARAEARQRGEDFDEKAYRTMLEQETPLGFVERTSALSARGEYGKWLRKRNVVAKVDGVVFLHGGLSPEVAALGCETINETVRRELTKDIDQTLQDPLASLTASATGPLWYRGLAREDEVTFATEFERVLDAMGARAIVVAHTVTGTSQIGLRFGGRLVMIDAGMAPHYGGHLAALEIGADGSMAALYPDGRVAIERPAAAAVHPPGSGTRKTFVKDVALSVGERAVSSVSASGPSGR